MRLEVGYDHAYEIRKAELEVGDVAPFSLCYISDLHFNKHSAPICQRLITDINELNPDLVLLGGDYVDTKRGLPYLEELLQNISPGKKLFAIAGNHDHFFGVEQIKQLMQQYGVAWIEQSTAFVAIGNERVRIDGNRICEQDATVDLSILCLHKPLPVSKVEDKYQLVLAGHLHGGQFVFWQNDNGLYPAKFFYPCNFIERRWKQGAYFVSKGLGDTLPLRYNCKKEFLFIQVNLKTRS